MGCGKNLKRQLAVTWEDISFFDVCKILCLEIAGVYCIAA